MSVRRRGPADAPRATGDDASALKVWLRLLGCTTRIQDEIRRRLHSRFGMSVARFDYLAQLQGEREGLGMKALSRRLMVTGGNITGLTDELEREGLVSRRTAAGDRRARIVDLTPAGRRTCQAVALEHERWVLELLHGLDAEAIDQLYRQLGTLHAALSPLPQPHDEERSWNTTASTPPCSPATAGRPPATGPRTSSGRSPTASRP